jgi:hypothetical protein
MKIERPTFPDEPIRRVLQEPKPAIINQDDKGGFEFRQEKSGQRYFWDSILEFPDSWTKSNKQIPLFTLPSFTKKEADDEDEYEQLELPQGEPLGIPKDYVQQNQEYWKNVERGRLPKTKPLLLNHTARFMHRRIVDTFGLQDAVEPVLALSVLYDKPKSSTSEYVYEYRFPEGVRKKDRKDFAMGIERITEYATNYATKEFFMRNLNFPGARSIAEIYGKLADFASYRFILGGTYVRMGMVEDQAILNGKDYKGALSQALFQHDFTSINELIADTQEASGCSNLEDLAIQIGKSRFKKPDLSKWLGKLEINKTDGSGKSNIKNCILSILAGGVYRNPGVIEISAGITTFVILETISVYALKMGTDVLSVANTLGLNLAVALTPVTLVEFFATVHERLHSDSSNKEYIGLIPARIVNKKTTPHMSNLEEGITSFPQKKSPV